MKPIDPQEAMEVRLWLRDAEDLRYRAAQAMESWYRHGSTQQEIAEAVGTSHNNVSRLMAALRESTCFEEFVVQLGEKENPTRREPPIRPSTDKAEASPPEPSVSPTEPERESVAPKPDGPTCDPFNQFEALAHSLLRFIQEHEQQADWAAKPAHVKNIKSRLRRVEKIMENY